MNKREYAEYLTHPEWASKRKKLFLSLGRKCSRSGCGVSISLQIHHKTYTLGKLPWEYPLENFEVLCEKHHCEAHGNSYVQNKCRNCGKDIPGSFETCIPCKNKADREQALEMERVKKDVGQLNATLSKSRVFLGFVVILTCFLAMVFWPQRTATEPTQSAAISIKSGDFRRHLGLFVEFNAQIVEVRYARNGNAYLDIGGRHPNATLTLVVFKNRLSRFGDLREFAGHTVRINGRVTQYQEALQVTLESKNQIRLE